MTTEQIKAFYNLALHETFEIPGNEDGMIIIRVPGGWIYFSNISQGVFVPFNNQFLPNN